MSAEEGANQRVLRIYYDGASRSNALPSVYAMIVCSEKDEVVKEQVEFANESNDKEVKNAALRAGLKTAATMGADGVIMINDTKLVVECTPGRWCVKRPGFFFMNEGARVLMNKFARVVFECVPYDDPMMVRVRELMEEKGKQAIQ